MEDEAASFILCAGVGRYNALDISVQVFRTKDPARTRRLVHAVQRAKGLRPGVPGPLLDLVPVGAT